MEGEIGLQVAGIAINADAVGLDGNLDVLREELDHHAGIGFAYVEIAPHGAGVIHGGGLHREQMKKLLKVLSAYPFRYVTHGPNPLNLMDREHLELEKRLFMSSLQFAGETGSGVMVYHAGRWLPEEQFQLPDIGMPEPDQQKVMWELERTLLQEMGVLAEQYGVTIAVENARPYLDASPYCYGEFLQSLAEMIVQVNHPRVGITLDLGHAFLASRHHGYNLLEGVDAVRPYIRHIHLHDNYGRCCASYEKKQGELLATGRGDLHLPIGWGEVPAREVFARLQDYRGVVTLEIRPRYRAFYEEALTNARVLFAAKGLAEDPGAAKQKKV
jgi:sugar phosphate isomerase/epimerase